MLETDIKPFIYIFCSGGNEHFHPLKQVKKIRTKFLRHPSTQGKATFLPSGEQEQNRVLEKMSPEYKYEDYGDSENSNTKDDSNISNLLDKQTIQELKSKNLLDGDTKHATRGEPSFVKVLTPSRSSLGGESLEKFNVLLQNTLPEYKFDKAERGRRIYVGNFHVIALGFANKLPRTVCSARK